MNKLFVGNLPFNVQESDLEALFQQAGRVKSVSLPVDRETGRKRGFGFVEMDNPQQANEAIFQLNNTVVEGRTIVVNLARPRAA